MISAFVRNRPLISGIALSVGVGLLAMAITPTITLAADFTTAANGSWQAGATWGNAGSTEGVDYPGPGDSAQIDHAITSMSGDQTFGTGAMDSSFSASSTWGSLPR